MELRLFAILYKHCESWATKIKREKNPLESISKQN